MTLPGRDAERLLRAVRSGELPAEALNVGAGAALPAPVDAARLRRILVGIAGRHPAMRLAFPDGRPAVGDAEDLVLDEVVGDPNATLREALGRDLHAGGWRFVLVRPAADRAVLLVVAPHVVADLRSFAIVLGEVRATLAGRPAAPPTDDEAAFARLAELHAEADPRHDWDAVLRGARPLRLEHAGPRPLARTWAAGTSTVTLPDALVARLGERASAAGVPLAAWLLAAWGLLLSALGRERSFAVAVPVDARRAVRAPLAVGLLATPIPLALHVDPLVPAEGLVTSVRDALAGALATVASTSSALPTLRRLAGPRPGVPALQAVFSYVTHGAAADVLADLAWVRPRMDLDLSLTVRNLGGALAAHVDYARDAVDGDLGDRLGPAFLGLVEQLVDAPERPVGELDAGVGPVAPPPRARLGVAATFTADGVVRALEGWGELLDLPTAPALSGYGQAVPDLLDPRSPLGTAEAVAVLVDPADGAPGLREALAASALRSGRPHLAVVMPGPGEERVRAELAGLPGVTVATPEPVDRPRDPGGAARAHRPFAPLAEVAAATAIARWRVRALHGVPKVVAVDGDHTLWGGVIGEDGAGGVALDGDHAAVHAALRALRARGIRLALVSRNDPDLVEAVLRRPESGLRPEDFAALSCGWTPKPERLAALAATLGCALDAVLFLDDDPAEIARMSAELPEVWSFRAPVGGIAPFLASLWLLAGGAETAEDGLRAADADAEADRRALLATAPDRAAWLAALGVEVEIAPLSADALPRASQLTRRTTQFTLRPEARSEAELARAASDGVAAVVRVRDRFADAGLTGLVVARPRDGALAVETLCLSCRVLGRGVEDRVLAWLAGEAGARGLDAVRLVATPTSRNTPVRRWLGSLVGEVEAADVLLDVEAAGRPRPPTPVEELPVAVRVPVDRRAAARRLAFVATHLRTPADAARALLGRVPGACVPSEGPPEARIAAAMAEVLGVEVPRDGDWFRLGGGSLDAVELLSRLDAQGLSVGLDAFLADPTPRGVALRLAGTAPEEDRLLRDAALAPETVPLRPRPPPRTLETIALTGATGFVGSFVLQALLRRTDARVVALVRGADDDAARARLLGVLRERRILPAGGALPRVEVLAADLERPGLGLAPERFAALAERVDAVIHAGARVDFVRPYDALRAANVEGTRAVLALASPRSARVHLVSTVAVLLDDRPADRLREDQPVPVPTSLPTGYARTKWVAERLVAEAHARGLPTTITRLKSAGPHAVTGVANPDDLATMVLRVGARTGRLPRVPSLDVAPVDWIAAALVDTTTAPAADGRTVHLAHPDPLDERAQARAAVFTGATLVAPAQWIAEVTAAAAADPGHPAARFAPILALPADRGPLARVLACPPVATDALRELAPAPAPPLGAALFRAWAPRGGPPFVVIPEVMRGATEDGEALHLRLELRAAGLDELVGGELAVGGEVTCGTRALRVVDGRLRLRPPGPATVWLDYALRLEDAAGRTFELRGEKRAGLDLWRRSRTVHVALAGEGLATSGTAVVTDLADQPGGMRFRDDVPESLRRAAVAAWYGALAARIGGSAVAVAARTLQAWAR